MQGFRIQIELVGISMSFLQSLSLRKQGAGIQGIEMDPGFLGKPGMTMQGRLDSWASQE